LRHVSLGLQQRDLSVLFTAKFVRLRALCYQ
jgi:hypothetical protein